MQTSLHSAPIAANYPSEFLTIGGGVAIYQIRTGKVVVCYHTLEKYWFLPKGRKNANESITTAAEREGFEETGYRNRLLPIPIKHKQTDPDSGHEPFVTEALWIQLMPLTTRKQYLLHWFIAETVPEKLELTYTRDADANPSARVYAPPAPFPAKQTLKERIAEDSVDGKVYEPFWHAGTGVNEDETHYKSYLFTIEEACTKLGPGVMSDVVRRGWEAIELRMEMEEQLCGA
jgi:8-oxo-dGTP pyrophosphatase MutT (NUDIX family)